MGQSQSLYHNYTQNALLLKLFLLTASSEILRGRKKLRKKKWRKESLPFSLLIPEHFYRSGVSYYK